MTKRRRKPPAIPEPEHPWERQPEESEPAFAAFAEYRDYERNTGEKRSIPKVAQRLSKSVALCKRWSSRNDWPARTGAWDGHLDALRASAAQEQARKDGDTLMAETLTMRKSVSIPIAAVLRRLEATPQAIDTMSIKELIELIPALAKALATIGTFERLQRGESTEHLAVAGPGDVEMQEAPTDEGYLRRFVKAAVDAGILDDDDDSDGIGGAPTASANGASGDEPEQGLLPPRTDGEAAPVPDA